jgi:8-oxo-dGTP diphosphatase
LPKEKTLPNAVVCFLVKRNQVLLGIKTRDIGKDRWNGAGGGIKKGETPQIAAIRELEEELGVVVPPAGLKKVAIILVRNTKTDGTIFICRLHVYLVFRWAGEPCSKNGELINLTWFPVDDLPEPMILSDEAWLPLALADKKFEAEAHLGPFQKTLLGEVKIKLVNSLPDD